MYERGLRMCTIPERRIFELGTTRPDKHGRVVLVANVLHSSSHWNSHVLQVYQKHTVMYSVMQSDGNSWKIDTF